jgi:hypothetical protein
MESTTNDCSGGLLYYKLGPFLNFGVILRVSRIAFMNCFKLVTSPIAWFQFKDNIKPLHLRRVIYHLNSDVK